MPRKRSYSEASLTGELGWEVGDIGSVAWKLLGSVDMPTGIRSDFV